MQDRLLPPQPSVPDRLLDSDPAIHWQAIQELSTGAKRLTIIAPGSINLATAVPFNEMDLKRTMDAYHRAITQALKAESESVQAQWQRQGEGQIY